MEPYIRPMQNISRVKWCAKCQKELQARTLRRKWIDNDHGFWQVCPICELPIEAWNKSGQ